MVTLLDVGAALHELRRVVSTLGFKGVYLRPNPVGGRALHDPAFDPFWAEVERLDVPVMFHEGTDGQFPTAGLDRYDNFCFLEPAHYEVAAATTQRNRWFADSLLDGAGFEPSVPLREW